ncbi:hypothetical protein PSTAB_1326 [Stutzerimonas stutzeri]|uniref:Uncharacterized protein n=1 Tax=Stutzerimonas stutzeri (strain ATCC 17588 / DSM 5190 / CCUG 11256 / JCM 5965 / LMG 11199 / NBRC 14165 / NCIMB 11358 / Stanier 221) TaxID=96563 RepID=F8H3J2_STUS2|nr:hypothetical protein PSTAB_1326 [Stutzerimonas stutzeri]
MLAEQCQQRLLFCQDRFKPSKITVAQSSKLLIDKLKELMCNADIFG